MRYQKLLQSLDPPPLPAGVSLFQEVFVQTIDLEKLDYRVYELPTEEQKTTRAALQRAYTEKMQEALRQFIGSERFVQGA